MRDSLPRNPKKIECLIINHDGGAQSKGTHWSSLAKVNDTAWYFDSFGNLLPPLEIKSYLGDHVKLLLNYNRYQKFGTMICGQLCLKFLYNFWQTINIRDFL